MQIVNVEYTGDGSSSHAITGVGFQPDWVLIRSKTGARAAYLSVAGIASGWAVSIDGLQTYASNAILSRDASGFTVGANANVNTNAEVYEAWCMRDDGNGDIKFGTYAGNSGTHAITGVGFTPTCVMVIAVGNSGHGDNLYVGTTATMANAFRFAGTAAAQANEITSLDADGFHTGNDDGTNGTGGTYAYVAFKANSGFIETGTYTGNGTDNHNITNSGSFQPNVVIVKKGSTQGCLYLDSYSTDNTLFGDTTTPAADYIQQIQSGGFQVGTNAAVNSGSTTYYYINLKNTVSPQPVYTMFNGFP